MHNRIKVGIYKKTKEKKRVREMTEDPVSRNALYPNDPPSSQSTPWCTWMLPVGCLFSGWGLLEGPGVYFMGHGSEAAREEHQEAEEVMAG